MSRLFRRVKNIKFIVNSNFIRIEYNCKLTLTGPTPAISQVRTVFTVSKISFDVEANGIWGELRDGSAASFGGCDNVHAFRCISKV